ncbi:hypothetical protein [Terrimonas ferruginea]|uniref:hypothetical protein n=1 Tax=Terrimonas ferruginea TaxID=249 RepID=UPI00041490F1|nr:hypothetical protein [Terrimonas ferruginea]
MDSALSDEVNHWKLQVMLLQSENMQFKHQVSELAQGDISGAQLMNLEDFLSKLIRKDEGILLLKQDIQTFERQLNAAGGQMSDPEIKNSADRIRTELDKLHYQFALLKENFVSHFSNE